MKNFPGVPRWTPSLRSGVCFQSVISADVDLVYGEHPHVLIKHLLDLHLLASEQVNLHRLTRNAVAMGMRTAAI